jgi:hypothetical protein
MSFLTCAHSVEQAHSGERQHADSRADAVQGASRTASQRGRRVGRVDTHAGSWCVMRVWHAYVCRVGTGDRSGPPMTTQHVLLFDASRASHAHALPRLVRRTVVAFARSQRRDEVRAYARVPTCWCE